MRRWHATRGLTRSELHYKLYNSFFAKEEDDLWASEVGPAVDDAYDDISKSMAGENFAQRVGIVHFQRWLDRKAHGKGAAYNRTTAPTRNRTLVLSSTMHTHARTLLNMCACP